ncbi:MAG: hypothetical protein K6B14_08660 [Lachnospiraceae bacterium]|nr:hypothetical protein [Lachnospiraceae bacterium]
MSNNFINNIFGITSGIAGMIGDYNSIKSGSYGKLLKSYYSEATSGLSGSKSSGTKTSNVLDRILEERRNPAVSKEVSAANSKLSSSVGSLKTALGSLQNEATYKDTENGSSARDKMTSALKNYVSSYNDAVESSKKTTMSNVSSNIAGAMRATKENEEALKEIGITINNDGTINLNEKKLQTAEFDKIKDIFDGNKAMSYGSKVASRLNRATYYVSSASEIKPTDSTSSAAVTTSNSKNLMESITNIKSDSLYSKSIDKDGKAVYNAERILSEAENFIKYYNATLTSSKNSSISGVTSNLASMMQKTANNSGALSQIGITLGGDGKLSINKDNFKGSDMLKVQDIFTKYAASIESNARLLNYYSTTGNNISSGYSSTGAYNTSAGDLVSAMYDKSK